MTIANPKRRMINIIRHLFIRLNGSSTVATKVSSSSPSGCIRVISWNSFSMLAGARRRLAVEYSETVLSSLTTEWATCDGHIRGQVAQHSNATSAIARPVAINGSRCCWNRPARCRRFSRAGLSQSRACQPIRCHKTVLKVPPVFAFVQHAVLRTFSLA